MTERQKVGKHEEGNTVDDVDSNKYNDNFDKRDPVVQNKEDDESDAIKGKKENDVVEVEGISENVDEGNDVEDINE